MNGAHKEDDQGPGGKPEFALWALVNLGEQSAVEHYMENAGLDHGLYWKSVKDLAFDRSVLDYGKVGEGSKKLRWWRVPGETDAFGCRASDTPTSVIKELVRQRTVTAAGLHDKRRSCVLETNTCNECSTDADCQCRHRSRGPARVREHVQVQHGGQPVLHPAQGAATLRL